ncbi:MAG: hypothetical protein ACOX4K_01470 [Bacillota bacterium]
MNPGLNQFNRMQLVLIALTVVYFAASFTGMNAYRKNLQSSRTEAIRLSIEKAAVQCYALEGSYPPNLEYLEENYGIQTYRDKYRYDYFAFASNIRPVIIVIEKAASW